MAGVTNGSMYTFEVAPVFSVMENLMMKRFREYVGWENGEGDGILTPGGSISNMYALNVARYHRWPETKDEGMAACGKLAIFLNKSAHYSIKKGAFFLGFGANSLYHVEFDENCRMKESSLREQVQKAKADGRTPFMVVATEGTTVFGAFDDIEMSSAVCKEENMWLHLDACLGGSMLASDEHKSLLKGSHLADSCSISLHKGFGVPQQCATFLTKYPEVLSEAHSANAAYLFQKDKLNREYDIGDKSIQCGRKNDILKIWLTFKIQGENGIAERINRMHALGRYLRDEIVRRGETEGSLKLVVEPQMMNTCFWAIPPSCRGEGAPEENSPEWREKVHNAAIKIKEGMQEKGSLMIGFQSIPIPGDECPPNFFRFVLSNPYMTTKDMDFILDEITGLAKGL